MRNPKTTTAIFKCLQAAFLCCIPSSVFTLSLSLFVCLSLLSISFSLPLSLSLSLSLSPPSYSSLHPVPLSPSISFSVSLLVVYRLGGRASPLSRALCCVVAGEWQCTWRWWARLIKQGVLNLRSPANHSFRAGGRQQRGGEGPHRRT